MMLVTKFYAASVFFFVTILVLLAACCLSSLDSSFGVVLFGCGLNIVGVESILSKCWNCYLALYLSASTTAFSLMLVTLGNLYTIKVRNSVVFETSFLSILTEVSIVSASNFEI